MQAIFQLVSVNSFNRRELIRAERLESFVERIDPYRGNVQEHADSFPTDCKAALSGSSLRQIKSFATGGRPSVHE